MKKKDIRGKYNITVNIEESEPIDDMMLFGRTKEANAALMLSGKLTVSDFMNEWYRRCTEDLNQKTN